MLEVCVTQDFIEKAKAKSFEMGKLNNSITSGDGNLSGFIGEFIVAELIGAEVSNTYDYDLIWDSLKIDVKTKRTNFTPKKNYECSIAAFNIRQKCDQYAFVRVKNDLSKAWVLGYYPKNLYFTDAKFHKKGDFDSDNGFTFKADCYNLKIEDLFQYGKA